jgi:hypothetical protein
MSNTNQHNDDAIARDMITASERGENIPGAPIFWATFQADGEWSVQPGATDEAKAAFSARFGVNVVSFTITNEGLKRLVAESKQDRAFQFGRLCTIVMAD